MIKKYKKRIVIMNFQLIKASFSPKEHYQENLQGHPPTDKVSDITSENRGAGNPWKEV